jgi:hypothetical protein
LATARALYAAGLPAGFKLVRALGFSEVVVAIWALSGPLGVPTTAAYWAIAALYASFGSFVAYALIFDKPLTTCGCVGSNDLPPTWFHAAIDLLVAASAAVAAAQGTPALRLFGESPLLSAIWLTNVLTCAVLIHYVLVRVGGPTAAAPAGRWHKREALT